MLHCCYEHQHSLTFVFSDSHPEIGDDYLISLIALNHLQIHWMQCANREGVSPTVHYHTTSVLLKNCHENAINLFDNQSLFCDFE